MHTGEKSTRTWGGERGRGEERNRKKKRMGVVTFVGYVRGGGRQRSFGVHTGSGEKEKKEGGKSKLQGQEGLGQIQSSHPRIS